MVTKSSGKEVENATSKKPIFVFPRLEMLAIFTELVIAQPLDLIKTISEPRRIRRFPSIPNCSSMMNFSMFA